MDASSTLATIIRDLGGPDYAAQEFEWVSSIPSGKILLEWIASQVKDEAATPDRQWTVDNSILSRQAALEPIALLREEKLEFQISQSLGIQPPEENAASTSVSPNYASPSRIRERTKYLEAEAELVENECELLKHRLRGAKVASKQLSKTITQLRATIAGVDSEISQHEESLRELSIKADSTLARSVDIATKLLDKSRPKGGEENYPLYGAATAEKRLAALSVVRSRIVALAEEQFRTVDLAEKRIPSPSELQQEAARLRDSLSRSSGSKAKSKQDASGTADMLYCAELDKITRQIEEAQDMDSVQQLLDKLSENGEDKSVVTNAGDGVLDVNKILENAWKLDQLALLEAREKILDQTTSLFIEQLVTPLKDIHSDLSQSSEQCAETEALISSLIEEFEQIADEVATSQEPHSCSSDAQKPARPNDLLQIELMDVMKKMQHLRPADTGPLVLLDNHDLEKELEAVSARLVASERAEKEWASALTGQLADLKNMMYTPVLSAIYADSPVNTSAPFALSCVVRGLDKDVHSTVAQLNEAVSGNQNVQLSERDKRKLTAFVEKWVRN